MNVVHWDGISPAPQTIQNHVVTIGNFDGVHQGHAALLRRLNDRQKLMQLPGMVITFDPPPIKVLKPDYSLEQLTTLDERIQLIRQFNIESILVLKTSPHLLELSAWGFWNELLVLQLQIRGMVEGRNFCFGKDRQGTVEHLEKWCNDMKVPLDIVDDIYQDGTKISSSVIRQALKQGNIPVANQALARTYSLYGTIVHGDHRGSKIGFPTGNLANIQTLIPRDGVYACLAQCEGNAWPAAVNIGPNPTFGVMHRKVEAHLLGFQGDLYGKTITLQFIVHLRDTQPFASLQALQSQLQRDIQQVDKIVKEYSGRIQSC